MKISEIGQGTWNYKGSVEPLRLGVSLVATHIDILKISMALKESLERLSKALETKSSSQRFSLGPNHLDYDVAFSRAAEGALSTAASS